MLQDQSLEFTFDAQSGSVSTCRALLGFRKFRVHTRLWVRSSVRAL